ncbi:MAG: hypothetical protein ACR2JU_02690 [Nocardioidaceae bacterium]
MSMSPRLMLPLLLFAAGYGGGAGTRSALVDPCKGQRVTGFAVSLVSSTGGAATPEEAAAAQSRRPGWKLLTQDSNGATVVGDMASRHVIQGADGTWQVDSGQDC